MFSTHDNNDNNNDNTTNNNDSTTNNNHNINTLGGLRPSVITCNAAITACGRGAQWERALDLLGGLPGRSLAPDLIGLGLCYRFNNLRFEDLLTFSDCPIPFSSVFLGFK